MLPLYGRILRSYGPTHGPGFQQSLRLSHFCSSWIRSGSRPTPFALPPTTSLLQRHLCYLSDDDKMCCGPATTTPAGSGGPDAFRLPTNVKPTHYDLTFKTDLKDLSFRGVGVIDLDVVEDTSEIQFNSSELTLDSDCALHSEALKTEQVQKATISSIDKDKERVTIKLSTTIPKGSKAKLHVGWQGKLTNSMTGYYFSSTEVEGQKVHYSLTQFEPTAARRAFPCWDEPLLKSTFSVTMVSRTDTVSLSNMSAISEKPFLDDQSGEQEGKGVGKLLKSIVKGDASGTDSKEWKITKFEKTPLMSTYLVAFANGPFEYLESSYTSPLSGIKRPLRIYGTKDIIHQAQFSLDVKAKVMPLYEKIFDIEYPLPKLDTLVAHDFDAGAMENWGLITGRTSAFLLDPKKSDIAAKKRVATVTSHECAHLWFGDLVTMAWWDNLWLNEGFATLMGEVITIERVFPEWRANTEFINNHLERALELDAVRSSHPIEVPVPDANQINQIFDALSYSKAGSVLRMVAAFVGEDTFLKGVSIYLKKRLYGNSVTKDLWEGIQESSGLDIPTMLHNWILKIGFPVVTVKETPQGIQVRQDRFLATGDPKPEENETIWHIPLSLLTPDENGKAKVDRKVVLTGRETTIPLDTSKLFKLNADASGVYRVAYTPERLDLLGKEAAKKDSILTLEDRMSLVSDALVLAKSGGSLTSSALNLVKALHKEEEYLMWSTISTQVGNLNSIYWEEPESVRDDLDAFRRFLFKPIVDKLGYEYSPDDSADTIQLRTLAITSAANAKDQSVIDELRSRFKHFQDTGDDSRIPADLLRITHRIGVKYGGREEYDTVKKVYKNPPTPTAKISAMLALTASEDPKIVEETLNFILSNEVLIQDVMYFFAGSAGNRFARRRIGEFFKENYDKFYKMFEGNFSLSYLIKYSFQDLTTEKDAKGVEEWFKDKDTSKYNLALAQSLDTIRSNAAWLERSRDDVTAWLAAWKREAKL